MNLRQNHDNTLLKKNQKALSFDKVIEHYIHIKVTFNSLWQNSLTETKLYKVFTDE
jgi:hypothetical protein